MCIDVKSVNPVLSLTATSLPPLPYPQPTRGRGGQDSGQLEVLQDVRTHIWCHHAGPHHEICEFCSWLGALADIILHCEMAF